MIHEQHTDLEMDCITGDWEKRLATANSKTENREIRKSIHSIDKVIRNRDYLKKMNHLYKKPT